ncbi:MAG: SprT family zinc-dependent metalloprotease [Pseudomonadota bacterium]
MTEIIQLDDPQVAVRLQVNVRARRFTLRLGQPGDGPVLTLPPGVPKGEARMFLLRQSDWLRRALDRQPDQVIVRDGTHIPIDGSPRLVQVTDGPRRAPRLEEERLLLSNHGAPGRRIAAWLKTRARDRMVPQVHSHAAELGRKVTGISLKDTHSRWGSCSSNRRISLSWRLAMAPLEVQDYLAAHEAAHLVEMNHSAAYWAVLARLMPEFERPRRWLKHEGRELHAYRFEAPQSET